MTFGNRKFTQLLGAATVVTFAEYVFVLSDSIIAGRVLGESALGAFGLLMALFSGIGFCTWLLAAGTSIVFSEAVGDMRRDRAANLAGQGLVAAVVLGLLLAGAVRFGLQPYVSVLAPDEVTRALAASYGRWCPAIAFLKAVSMLMLFLVFSNGGERWCLCACVAQTLANVTFSYGFCDGLWGLPQLGMAGVSLGTAVAYLVGLAAVLPFVLRRSNGLAFAPRLMPRELLQSLKAGFGDACAPLAHAVLFFCVSKYVIEVYGSDSLPVAALVFCVIRLTVFFNGVGLALQPMESVYRGEGNSLGVLRLVRFASAVAIAESVIVSGVVFIAPELIVSLFGMGDPELAAGAARAMRLSVIGLSGYAVTYLLNSHYRQSGRPWRSVRLTIASFLAAPAVLMLLLVRSFGLDGVWIALSAGPVFTFASLVPLWRPQKVESVGMWSLGVKDALDRQETIEGVEEALRARCEPAVVRQLTDALVLSIKRVIERNAEEGGRCRVRMEVTLLFGAESVVLILRDDGAHVALEGLEGTGIEAVHMPTAGCNRNVMTVSLAKKPAAKRVRRERKSSRYAVLRGTDVAIEDIRTIIALDRQSFDDRYQVSAEDDMALFRLNRENGLVIRDTVTNEVVGYSMILPVKDEVYERIRSGSFVDTELTPDMLLDFGRPGEYRIYFASIVVHPEHRSASLVMTMMNAMAEDFIALAERGIFGKSLTADVVSRDGEKFCQLFGLSEVKATDHGSKIFEVSALPPKFRVSTETIARLSGLYWEHYLGTRPRGAEPPAVV